MTVLTKDADKFVETRIEDETVVMALDSGDFFSLQDTARAIWEKIDGSRDRDAIVATLAKEYGIAGDAISVEVDAFLAELVAAGLIRHD